MSILFRIASRVNTKSYPEYFEQQWPETETSRSHTSKIDQHRVGAVDREGLVHSIPALTPEYLLLSQWVLPLRYLFTLYRNVTQLRPVTEIAPKSPVLCVNRSLNRYDFRGAGRLFSRGVIFTRARVSLALLFLRKNGGLLVV